MPTPFVSYAPNREDVVLNRVFGDVLGGRYLEVGAEHPLSGSVTRALYEQGWSGIAVEPVPAHAVLRRAGRPRDVLIEAVHAGADLLVPDATRALEFADIFPEGQVPGALDLVVVSAGGAEARVLAALDLATIRPQVLVIRATTPAETATWEPGVTAAGYEYRLFDGMSRFYVATEHAARLGARLSFPACARDGALDHRLRTAQEEVETLRAQSIHWRHIALTAWSDTIEAGTGDHAADDAEVARLRTTLAAMEATVSWRVTAPIRTVRRLLGRARTR